MHKLMQYLCDELEELERKVDKEGKLSMAEIQYMDTLAHTKKNLLKADELWEESEYSMDGGSYEGGRGGSYARRGTYTYARGGRGGSGRGGNRGGNRGGGGANQYGSYAMDGYSRANDMADQLRDMMQDAPDEKTRQEIQRLVSKLEQM